MKLTTLSGLLVLALAVCMRTAPSLAQSFSTYVSVTGNDNNACDVDTAPCRSFQGAHSKTEIGGKITCLSSGEFFNLSITKSITVDCTGHNNGRVFIVINNAEARVTLQGLRFDGRHVVSLVGVDFQLGQSLHVENASFANFGGGPPASGIYFRPSSAARLYVTDSTFSNNGTASTGGGIVVHPQGSGSAIVTLNRVTLNGNRYGVFAQGLASTGQIIIDVRDTSVSGSTAHGMAAITDSSLAAIVIQRSSSVQNAGAGILAQGAGALVHIGGSTVRGNAVGLQVSGGGNILSFQNNEVFGNGIDGSPTGVLTLK